MTCRLLCCSLLCCSVALYALLLCGHRAECRKERVSLVYRIVRFPSFIGASCSTHVLESVITTNSIHCANHFFPAFVNPWFNPINPAAFQPRYIRRELVQWAADLERVQTHACHCDEVLPTQDHGVSPSKDQSVALQSPLAIFDSDSDGI